MAISQNTLYYVALSHFPKFGPKRLGLILKNKTDFKKLFEGSSNDFTSLGIEENITNDFLLFRKTINLEKINETLHKEDVKIITPLSQEYPRLLQEIHSPPAILFCKGNLSALQGQKISIVGTRQASHYGLMITEQIIASLSGSNTRIVSGLAMGIDTKAHQCAIQNELPTIAVLGTGINNENIYPRQNLSLAKSIIASNGLIISEFPFGTEGLRHHFPQRNRIIAGLTKFTIVIEAAKKSGALITAHLALEQNRDVFAVPGNINNKVAEGPNELIKQGAIPITNINDVLLALDLTSKINYSNKKKIPPLSEEEKLVIAHLSTEPIHIDDLVYLTKQPISSINSTLTLLEIKGAAKNIGNMTYVIL